MKPLEEDVIVQETVKQVLADLREHLGLSDLNYMPNRGIRVRLVDVIQAVNLTESEWLDD